MSNRRHRVTSDEHVILSVLVERKPTFSFELTKMLRWHDGVTELLAAMEGKRLIERNRSGAYFPTKAGCDAARISVRSDPKPARWGHLVIKATSAWDWLAGDYSELAAKACG
jgi:hypothetical protein